MVFHHHLGSDLAPSYDVNIVFHHGFGTIHQRAPSYGVNTLAELGREYGIWYYSPKSLYWYDCQLPNYDVNMVFHHALGTIHPTA